jgi:hypothetical protein
VLRLGGFVPPFRNYNGAYTVDAATPQVNGHPHYSKGCEFHLYRSPASGSDKWLLSPDFTPRQKSARAWVNCAAGGTLPQGEHEWTVYHEAYKGWWSYDITAQSDRTGDGGITFAAAAGGRVDILVRLAAGCAAIAPHSTLSAL